MASRSNWARRRWLDFRQGHTIYLVFAMTFLNFITIQYALLIEKIPTLSSLFTHLWIFAIIFVAVYIPLAIGIGYWHRKSQMKIEQEVVFYENVIGARMWLFMLELIEGNVTEDEKKEMRTLLRKIVKKGSSDVKFEIGNLAAEEKSKSL